MSLYPLKGLEIKKKYEVAFCNQLRKFSRKFSKFSCKA